MRVCPDTFPFNEKLDGAENAININVSPTPTTLSAVNAGSPVDITMPLFKFADGQIFECFTLVGYIFKDAQGNALDSFFTMKSWDGTSMTPLRRR